MASFFKTFGLGILYVVLLPVFLLILALYAVYCLVMFIYMAIRNVIIFFAGGKPLGDMKEDVEAKRILLMKKEKEQAIENMLLRQSQMVQPQPVMNQDPYQGYAPQDEANNVNEEFYEGNDVEISDIGEDNGGVDDGDAN